MLNIQTIQFLKASLYYNTFQVFERKSLSLGKIEVLPLPYPVLTKFVRVHPIRGEYIGGNHGFRFDVIVCIHSPGKYPLFYVNIYVTIHFLPLF